jgi:hypothetical protein
VLAARLLSCPASSLSRSLPPLLRRCRHERDCACSRCRCAEHDGRSCCNHLLVHFSKLLMFRLIWIIWIASARPLCSCCCDWFPSAPIWKAGKKIGMVFRAVTPLGLVRFLFDQLHGSLAGGNAMQTVVRRVAASAAARSGPAARSVAIRVRAAAHDIAIHIRCAHASGFYGSKVIELCPPRGGYNPVGLRKVPHGAR